MQIGELAKKAGTKPSTVRYYEDAGLLPPADRTESGYRDYSDDDLRRIRLVLQAREMGFSIQETRVIVGATGSDDPCPEVAEIVARRLANIDRDIARLQEDRRRLDQRLHAWRAGNLSNADCICAILESPKRTQETTMSNKPTIEVFTAGCKNCDEAVRVVKEAVGPCGCNVVVLPADGEEAKRRNINLAPCIWKDGERVFCGVPTLEEAIAKLRVAV